MLDGKYECWSQGLTSQEKAWCSLGGKLYLPGSDRNDGTLFPNDQLGDSDTPAFSDKHFAPKTSTPLSPSPKPNPLNASQPHIKSKIGEP